MKITLVFNRGSGTLRGRDAARIAGEVADIFRAYGHVVDALIEEGPGTVAAIARISRQGSCDAVVVGGGDGTVSAAAAAVAASGIGLGVLPLGTMNLFARSLRIPLRITPAAEALAAGSLAKVDIGEVNGRLFVHHVTLGLHPRILSARESLPYGSAFGKLWATAQAWWIVLGRPPRLHARMTLDGEQLERRTAAILVSNNPLGDGHIPYPDELDLGKLGVYVPTAQRWHDLVRLTATLALGDVARNTLLERWLAEDVEVSLPGGEVVASIDGEVVMLDTPLRFHVRKNGLNVLKPVAANAGRAERPTETWPAPGNSVAAKDGTAALDRALSAGKLTGPPR